MSGNKIAHVYWSKQNPIYYIASKKGKIGDWGYSPCKKDAIELSPYWQRRLKADCERMGREVFFLPHRTAHVQPHEE